MDPSGSRCQHAGWLITPLVWETKDFRGRTCDFRNVAKRGLQALKMVDSVHMMEDSVHMMEDSVHMMVWVGW